MSDSSWPYHMKRDGSGMARCKSNPCRLHGGSDVMATSAEDAMEKYESALNSQDAQSESHVNLTSSSNNALNDVKYENVEAQSEGHNVDIDSLIRDGIDNDGMLKDTLIDDGGYVQVFDEMSSRRLDEHEQSTLLSLAGNADYMSSALKKVDYNKLPIATESLNILSSNPSTSSETLHGITNIALSHRKNQHFKDQVYITDIANNRNLDRQDAQRLYNAYPEECVRAQNFDKDIINDALSDPITPDKIRAIALTNPQASADAMESAIRDGGNAFKAQAMLNPNGRYLYAARKARGENNATETTFDDSEYDKADEFRRMVRNRTGHRI